MCDIMLNKIGRMYDNISYIENCRCTVYVGLVQARPNYAFCAACSVYTCVYMYTGSCHPEGFVVKTVEGFSYEALAQHIAKYVRAGHLQTGGELHCLLRLK